MTSSVCLDSADSFPTICHSRYRMSREFRELMFWKHRMILIDWSKSNKKNQMYIPPNVPTSRSQITLATCNTTNDATVTAQLAMTQSNRSKKRHHRRNKVTAACCDHPIIFSARVGKSIRGALELRGGQNSACSIERLVQKFEGYLSKNEPSCGARFKFKNVRRF